MDAKFRPAQTAIALDNAEEVERLVRAAPSLVQEESKSTCDHPSLLNCLVLEMPPRRRLVELIKLFTELGSVRGGSLGAATCVDNVAAVETLLDLGEDVAGDDVWSPLEEALYWGHTATVDLLLKRGAPVDNLRKFAALGDVEGVKRCFEGSIGTIAWPFGDVPDDVRNDRQQVINNALVFAAVWGQTETADELLRRGAEINAIPAGFDFAGTPLHYAALNNRREMADWLIARGADPTIRDTKVQNTPDGWADYAKHPDLAEHLRSARLTN